MSTLHNSSQVIVFEKPPKMVFAPSGELVEVTIPASEYHAYLRFLSENFDWESLPAHLQDAIDLMLIDEVRSEKNSAVEFSSLLTVQ